MANNFWEEKTLDSLNNEEWEALCDGCGRCCLNKLECADTLDIFYTDVACKLFDDERCRCQDYLNRKKLVPDCLDLKTLKEGDWYFMPDTCAYRLIKEGKNLFDWHPLIEGNDTKMHQLGISVKNKTQSEENISDDQLEDHIITWVTN